MDGTSTTPRNGKMQWSITMSDLFRRFSWVSVYAIAMAFLEAVVVAYIRELLRLSHRADLDSYAMMEVWREAATIIMLVAVGWLAGRNKFDRLAYGMFAFALWDIWYYIWLKVLVDWPKTLLDWDTLFLIPFPWLSPVLSPVLIAILICVVAVLTVYQVNRQETPKITSLQVVVVLCGAMLALYVFMSGAIQAWINGGTSWRSAQPEVFNWPLFLIALIMMAVPSLMVSWPTKKRA
jgi:hypothetical protein